MHKVVVERPRWNPGPGKQGRRANLSDELLPKFEGIKRPHRSRKGLTDLLGPLKRWLQSQVGRPWNEVYSEACAVIKPDSIIRAHVKTHLLEFVQRNAFITPRTSPWPVSSKSERQSYKLRTLENYQHGLPLFIRPERWRDVVVKTSRVFIAERHKLIPQGFPESCEVRPVNGTATGLPGIWACRLAALWAHQRSGNMTAGCHD
jgi:hypothetical protein